MKKGKGNRYKDFEFGQSVTIHTVEDLKRLRDIFGLTQQNLADDLGKSKSYIGQIESKNKNLSDNFKELLSDYFTEQSKMKKVVLTKIEEENEGKRDKYISNLSQMEQRKAIVLEHIAKRKSAFFSPSIIPSIDMIWLQNVIDGNKKKILFDSFINTTDPQIDVTHKQPNRIERDCEYLIQIECVDVHITVMFGFKTKNSNGKVTNKLVVQFNPNKADFNNNVYLQLLFYILGSDPKCRKFDVCKDYVGVPMSTVSISNTQRKGNYQYISKGEGATHYLGDINNNGIRVYDKRAEIKSKDSIIVDGEKVIKDIGYECIRYEHRRCLERTTELSKIANELEGINLPILASYDCKNLLCSTDEINNSKIDMYVYSTAIMVLEGRIPATELKIANRNQYNKVMKYLEMMKLDSLCISDIEIVQAIVMFVEKYQKAYEMGYNIFDTEVKNINKQYIHVTDESIDKATDMLCRIFDGDTEKVEIKKLTKEEKKEQIRKMGERQKKKNTVFVQTSFETPSNDTKYF